MIPSAKGYCLRRFKDMSFLLQLRNMSRKSPSPRWLKHARAWKENGARGRGLWKYGLPIRLVTRDFAYIFFISNSL